MPCKASLKHIFSLCGDSYPRDERIERRVAVRVAAKLGIPVTPQEELLAEMSVESLPDLGIRTQQLAARVQRLGPGGVVLIGRSSGARIVTQVALENAVTAVVCLGYPFKHPKRDWEPERVDHLSRLTVPTLILQGVEDSYGSVTTVEACTLSPSVRVEYVQGDHRMRIPKEEWARMRGIVTEFLRGISTRYP